MEELRGLERHETARVIAAMMLVICFGCAGALAQAGQVPATIAAPPTMPSQSLAATMATSISNAQNPFLGSVTEKGVPGVYPLSLQDALNRGLKYNLGLLLSNQAERQARGAQLSSLSKLLPDITARVSGTEEQINLQALGFPGGIPGIPTVVGPFTIFDARGFVTQRLLDLQAIYNLRSSGESRRAAQASYKDARDLVVLVVGGSYMQGVAGAARIDAAKAQVQTAQALYQQTSDMKKAGVVAGIDVLRSQVELQAQQQRLLAVQNEYEKEKMALARTIGFP